MISSGLNTSNITTGGWGTINTKPQAVLAIKEGEIQLGDDFTITVEELVTCVKYLRKLAMKECPEDFI